MEFTPSSFNHLVKNRRSVFPKQFDTSRKVPDQIIEQVLENACWAPNHGQAEPWFFTVFAREGLQTFAALQSSLYEEASGEDFKESKCQQLKEKPLLASHIISIGMRRTTTKAIPEMEDIAAVACAVQNMYLSVTAYGLGGYWTTGGVNYFESAKKKFWLPRGYKLLGYFYNG